MAKIGINIVTGSLQQQEMIVGIDLGTTNSLVAMIHPESRRPVVLKEYDSVPWSLPLCILEKAVLSRLVREPGNFL